MSTPAIGWRRLLRARAWWALAIVSVLGFAWVRGVQPVLDQYGGWSGLGRSLTRRVIPAPQDSVGFETGVDSTATDVLALREPGFRGIPSTAVLEVGVVTSVSGVTFRVPPALEPASEADGARALTLTLIRDGRELGSARCRFDSLGARFRMRPRGRLSEGDYDLRVALASPDPTLPPVVLLYRLRAR